MEKLRSSGVVTPLVIGRLFEGADVMLLLHSADMEKIDVAPTKDRAVYGRILSVEPTDKAIPLMTGHTFHSKEFDLVIFFLAKSLESAWEFVKALRVIDGVWDTEVNIIAHFEGLVPLKRFKDLVSMVSARSSRRRRVGEKKIAE